MMTFGSVYSGVGGADLGFERAGWTVAWQVETDLFRRAVLSQHWPEIPRPRDVREAIVPAPALVYAELPTAERFWLDWLLTFLVRNACPMAIVEMSPALWAEQLGESLGPYRIWPGAVRYEVSVGFFSSQRTRIFLLLAHALIAVHETIFDLPPTERGDLIEPPTRRPQERLLSVLVRGFEAALCFPQDWTCICGQVLCRCGADPRMNALEEATPPFVAEPMGRLLFEIVQGVSL